MFLPMIHLEAFQPSKDEPDGDQGSSRSLRRLAKGIPVDSPSADSHWLSFQTRIATAVEPRMKSTSVINLSMRGDRNLHPNVPITQFGLTQFLHRNPLRIKTLENLLESEHDDSTRIG